MFLLYSALCTLSQKLNFDMCDPAVQGHEYKGSEAWNLDCPCAWWSYLPSKKASFFSFSFLFVRACVRAWPWKPGSVLDVYDMVNAT